MYCWGFAASTGMEAQVKSLAEALGVDMYLKEAHVKPPYAWLPNVCYTAGLSRFVLPHMLTTGSDKLQAPWPEIVISCGRRPAIVALGLKHVVNRQITKFIHIQDPQVASGNFDLVIAMEHDKIEGSNVLKARYALHNITPQKLEAARAQFEGKFGKYTRPYHSVLLGGSTNKYTLSTSAMQDVIVKLRAMLESGFGSLLITTSRRSGAANTRLLKEVFLNNPRVFIYDGDGENPYLGLLALADDIVVTNDSVNMMSEAAATGKPIYILPLTGHSNTKPTRFSERLLRDGIARLWGGHWERWQYDTGDEMAELAKQVKSRLSIF